MRLGGGGGSGGGGGGVGAGLGWEHLDKYDGHFNRTKYSFPKFTSPVLHAAKNDRILPLLPLLRVCVCVCQCVRESFLSIHKYLKKKKKLGPSKECLTEAGYESPKFWGSIEIVRHST